MALEVMGRKPTFKTETEFEDALAQYIHQCETKQRMPNIAGMCVKLDISRPVFYEYCKKYPNTIRRAEAHIEDAWVSRLSEPGATGAIFYLKNKFRKLYKDRQEINNPDGNLKTIIIQKSGNGNN